MSIKSRAANSSLFLFVEYGIKFSLGIATTSLIARSLGPENSGHLSYVLSMSLMLLPLYTLSINEYSVRDLVKKNNPHEKVMGTTFVLKLAGGIVSLLLLFIIADVVNIPWFLRTFVFINALFYVFKAFEVVDNWYLSEIRSKEISLKRNFIFVGTSLLKIILWLIDVSWEPYVLISCVECVALAVVYIYSYQHDGYHILHWKFDFILAKQYLKKALPFLILTVFSTLQFKIDQVLVQKFYSSASLGEYLAAVKLIEIWNFAPLVIISVYFSKIVKSHEIGIFHQHKIDFYSLITIPTFLFVGVSMLVSHPIVVMIYGQKFPHTGTLLSYYLLLLPFTYFWWARMRIALLENKLLPEIAVSLIATGLFLAEYFTLPPAKLEELILQMLVAFIASNILVAFYSPFIRESLIDFIRSLKNIGAFKRALHD